MMGPVCPYYSKDSLYKSIIGNFCSGYSSGPVNNYVQILQRFTFAADNCPLSDYYAADNCPLSDYYAADNSCF
jgi:hypothetical protein